MEKTYPHMRWMIKLDQIEVLDIIFESFENPWLKDDLVKCFKIENNIGLVAEDEQKVKGFIIYHQDKTKLELLNLGVHPDYRRQGIGTFMINHLKKSRLIERRKVFEAYIRESNLVGQLFLNKNGFVTENNPIIRDYYEDTGESAYKLIYRLKKPKERLYYGKDNSSQKNLNMEIYY